MDRDNKIRKLMKAPSYIRHILLFFILWIPARLLRKMSGRYRNLWLVSERGNDARDNGYWLFRYLREKHPEINARYVISCDSPDYGNAAALGETVIFRSLRHHLMYLAADYLVSAHVQPAAPDMVIYYHLAQIGIRAKGKQVFLQHGIIKDDMEWLHYPKLRVDMFVSGALPEFEYLKKTYGHPDGVIRFLGLCRFDSLVEDGEKTREILVMPTWRGAFYPHGDDFPKTMFYRSFQALLSDPKTSELLDRLDFRLIFYPHAELQDELRHFTSPSDRIILARREDYDVHDLLKRCRILITDYSSVFFDAAYMNKPVIYYQFDEDEFRSYHYKQGYFSYERDGFGPVVRTHDELMKALCAAADNGFESEELYRSRADSFFGSREGGCCERTYAEILKLGKGGQ